MKQKCFAILCVLSLCVPFICLSETTEIALMCDTCGNQDICDIVVTGEGEVDGVWGEFYDIICRCGACLYSTWRQTGPAPAPSEDSEQKADPPADPVYVPPANNDPPADTGSGDPPVDVEQPESKPQTQSELPAKPEEPISPPSTGGDSGSTGVSEPGVVVQSQTQPQTQLQSQPVASPEEPISPPPSTSGDTGSSNVGNQGVTIGNAPAQQSQSEALPQTVTGAETPSEQFDLPGGESEEDEQNTSSEDPDPKTDDPVIDTEWGEHVLPEKTRNYAKYPLFSAYYPSRRLNMECDPDAWANIPGEKIYPISGTSLLAEMLNGGQ